ncbi:MAG: PAS domain S-box protein [Spirulina sp.]
MTTTDEFPLGDNRWWPAIDHAVIEAAWIDSDAPLSQVAQHLMATRDRVVVVVRPLTAWVEKREMRPLGVITEAEIVRACAQGQPSEPLTAEALMVNAMAIKLGDPLPTGEAVGAAQPHPYLLVTGCQGQLLGVIAVMGARDAAIPRCSTNLCQGTQQALQTQRNYNHLIASIISRFVDIDADDLAQEIRRTLALVCEVAQVEASYLSFYNPSEAPDNTHQVWVDGLSEAEMDQVIPGPTHLPWSYGLLRQDQMVYVPKVADLPAAAAGDRDQWQRQGVGAILSLPLVHRSAVVGAIGLVARRPRAWWLAETIQMLQVLGKMLVSTQQRLADEHRLQESEARLRLALSATNQGLYDVDLTTGKVVISPEYATMLGYDPATFEETEEHWRSMLHPEDREAALATYDAYIAGAIPNYRLEFRLKTQAGNWKWLLSLGKIVAWDEEGRPLRMLGTHTDIDEFKQAEAALRASEIRFRTFMDNSPMVAWIVDPETHRLEYASRGWYRNYASLTPISPTPQGQSLFDLFPAEIAQVYAHHNRWVVDHDEGLEVVEPGVHPDHSPGEFLSFKFPLPQPNGKTLVGGVAIDITERNRTEQRLALQSAILASIARSEPLGDILTDLVVALEDHLPGSLCSILFCRDDNRLYPAVAPHLPDAYSEALRGTAVGEAMGSCGTAALRRQPVIVEDIATDPLWADFRDLALAHGLRACWSIPVFASDGPVLATFAVYYRQPQKPYPYDLDTLQLAANLVKIAIEKDQATQALECLNRELEDRVTQRTEALRYSKARLKEAQQVAHLGRWEMDGPTRQITWSEEIMVLLGHPPGQGCGDLRPHVSEATWNRFNRLIDQVLATGEPCSDDLPVVRLDGSQGYLFVKATSHRSHRGEITRIFGIAMDVSERKAMQHALQRSEERVRATLLALPDLIFRVNREGVYLDFMVSPALGNLVDPQQAVGKHLSEALPFGTSQDHLAQKLTTIHHALDTQTVQCYEQVIPLNGRPRYEEVRVAPCGPDEVVFFIRDISDRKCAELELIRSRDLREAIFNESTDALFLVDVQTGRTLDCNQRAVDLFEASKKHQLVNIEGHRLQVHPFSENDLRAIYTILSSSGVWSQEVEYRTFSGQRFWGNIAAKLITVGGQQLKLVRVTDISDRKQAEAVLQQTNQELARATRMKDEFLANMSHELRTPLNAILGMAEGLQDGVFGPLNDRQHKALGTIESSGSHLLEVINDILDLAKIEAGQMSLDLAPVAITYLCSSSLAFVQPQAIAKAITLKVNVPDHLPDLLVDERRLRQVLINLLNNAVKFTPTDGTITLTAQRLETTDPTDTPWVRITVGDTGIGIAPEHLEKLFKPFVQIDSTLNRQYSGTGLGLALVQRIIDLHGGQIQVRSEVGIGSHFSLDLPCVTYPTSPLQVKTLPANATLLSTSTPSASPLILLAEDNEANAATISSYLGAKGYRLNWARTGQEAVKLAQAHHPDLILMDIQMPDVDGLEASRQIRADPNLAETTIVALTALAMPQDSDRCLAAGINEYIRKPIKLKDLAEIVRALLSQKEDIQ